jgi:hypothetical protein
MKKLIIFLLALVAMTFTSCEKDSYEPKSCSTCQVGDDSSNDDTGETAYEWPGYPIPHEPIFVSRNKVSGYSNVYDYKFSIHLDGSQIDPEPSEGVKSFAIPHVGPGGVLIYENVANDATYTINSINGSYIYYTIRSEAGHELKYNIAKREGTSYIWFLRYGLSKDDGTTNVITFVTY